MEKTEIKITQHKKDKKRKPFIRINALEESDDDEDAEFLTEESYRRKYTPQLITWGTQLKLLANIYLRNMDQRANVFLPLCKLDFKTPNGSIKPLYLFFQTDKKENCIFVSGGLHNIWEKNVNYVNKTFFDNNLKVIRARWVQKYFPEEKVAKNFKDREQDLHSEFYYDLFFRKRFIPQLRILKQAEERKGNTLANITIKCFSWWAVCNSCEKNILSTHGNLLVENNILKSQEQLSYQIIARRRYTHAYPSRSAIQKTLYLGNKGDVIEQTSWKKIWAKIVNYTEPYLNEKMSTGAEQEIFWTETKEGLEVCKWLGQAFRENIYDLNGNKARPGKKGDVLHYYNGKYYVKEEELERLKQLLVYLEEKNWELCCWYRSPYPSGGQTSHGNAIEQTWKKHWNQVIIPHYNWQVHDYEENEGGSEEDEEEQDDCQMCGYEKLKNYYIVSHNKIKMSDKYEFDLQKKCPESDKIRRETLFVLYPEGSRLFARLKKQTDPLEIIPSGSITQALIKEIIGIIQENDKPRFENRPQEQKALLDFAFAKRYTLSNKFWRSKAEKEERACLIVGSKCVKTLEYTEENIEEWRETHPREDRERIAENRASLSDYGIIERAERELKKKERDKGKDKDKSKK